MWSGIFTHTETRLAVTEEGRKIIKSARQELRAINHTEIEQIIADIIGCSVLSSYCDIDTRAGEQMDVYVLEADLENASSGRISITSAGWLPDAIPNNLACGQDADRSLCAD